MAVETVMALTGAARLIAKPINDLYEAVKQGVKNQAKQWSAIADIESVYGKLFSVSNVRTIVSSTPIPLTDFYYPARLQTHGPDKQRDVKSMKDISHEKSVLIFGAAGQGKSTFMRYLCIKELEFGERIPIFIELREVDEKQGVSDLLKKHLTFLGIRNPDDELLEFLLDSGRFVYFLDGFDEVKREYAHGVQSDLKSFMAAHPKTQWVISSRRGSLGEHLSALPGVLRYSIAPLGPDDFDPFFRALKIADESRERLLAAIKASPTSIRNVLTTPLMLTLLNSTFGTSVIIPATLHEFYMNMFHVLVSRHDDTKPFYCRQKATNLSNTDLQSAFSAFCFFSKDISVSLTDEQFSQCAKQAMKITGHTFTVDGFKTDLLDSVCLMARDGLKTAFIHKSIQEFFAAYFVSALSKEEQVRKVYDRYRRSKWSSCQSEIKFLEQIDEQRFLEFYHFPALDELVRRTGFDSSARIPVTKKKFDEYVAGLEMYMLSVTGLKEPLLVFVVDSPSIDPLTCEFFATSSRLHARGLFPRDELDSILESVSGAKTVPFYKYLRSNKKERAYYSTKLIEYVEKLEKERGKLMKKYGEIDKQLDEYLDV